MTVLNGIGAEEVVRAHGAWPIVSGVTFMSGTRHSDTHVEYILDTETWLGPYEDTPFAVVQDIADTIVASGLKAEALPDLRPAQWSKLIFNASVNPTAALTGLPHDFHFAQEGEPGDLGHLVHGLVDEGKAVAAAAGIELHDDPWEMNVLATRRGSAHYPSMLEDVDAQRQTEIELITGSLVREAERRTVSSAAARTALCARTGKGSIVAGNAGTNRRAEMTNVRRGDAGTCRRRGRRRRRRRRRLGCVHSRRDRHHRLGVRRSRRDGRRSTDRRSRPRRQRIAAVNKTNATKLRLITCNTQGNKPAIAKACATKLAEPGRRHHHDDVRRGLRPRRSSRQRSTAGSSRSRRASAPTRWARSASAPKGRLAFSFGNVAQDEGSAMAEYAWKRGWRTASLATDTVIVYFRNVVQAFEARFTQLGGTDRDEGDVPVARRQPGVVAERRSRG